MKQIPPYDGLSLEQLENRLKDFYSTSQIQGIAARVIGELNHKHRGFGYSPEVARDAIMAEYWQRYRAGVDASRDIENETL